MSPVRLPNIDENGNFTDPQILERLNALFGNGRDTGSRDVRASMVNVGAGGSVKVRRIGDQVALTIYNVPMGSTTQIADAGWLGPGFTPADELRDFVALNNVTGNPVKEFYMFATGALRVYGTATGNTFGKTITWTTLDPWPTTLPGTAA